MIIVIVLTIFCVIAFTYNLYQLGKIKGYEKACKEFNTSLALRKK